MIEYISFLAGCTVMVLGAVGVIRFPDVYTRLHAATKCDTGGAISILVGVVVILGMSMTSLKVMLVLFLIFFLNPVASHALARASHRYGIKPCEITVVDMYE
ncbi:MAG: monovalent cation/H(+) antiporter subunit G [Theionarchaea archaeon]|nr:monovalent cation/H(+) antiporter subunit G [Theionarchaea archaeon]MBU7000268.1 monovalent cation/H(+) antiporter subunit G [Theionarchaea archaeon]MBU7022069.1 monovalent cation/H(+) antiporter subunit G [Theionarchaea archaeon]MBU7034751.1 monovalent cation/H(+) antiporter subunit G [Theionarchaea archaeon]MBU7040462.1 monovalent cation/H(+) antiporter subunit G [Theionarchaea archaeon]